MMRFGVPGLFDALRLVAGSDEDQGQALRLLPRHQFPHGGRQEIHAQHDGLRSHGIPLVLALGAQKPISPHYSRAAFAKSAG